MIRSFAVALLLHTGLALSKAAKNSVIYANHDTITLSSNGSKADIVVLDYGYSVEGHPTFEVVSRSGDTSGFELTFAESKAALNSYMVSYLVLGLKSTLLTHRNRAMALFLSPRQWRPTA